MEKNIFSNLISENKNHEDIDIRSLFAITFALFSMSEKYNILYKNDADCKMVKRLIQLYYKKIKPNYNNMIYSFKNKYIINEALVEKNDTPEQKKGLRDVYDYIQNYDKPASEFNILIESLAINERLWKPTDDKNLEGKLKEQCDKKDECLRLIEEGRKEKNIAKIKAAKATLNSLSSFTNDTKIGGRFRQGTSEVQLQGYEFLVPSGEESCKYINKFASPEKIQEFIYHLENDDVIDYIEYCVKICADLIKYQPFKDGNKRTFRSLLNLMFKAKNLPPVYIRPKEREEYKKVLFQAIEKGEYEDLVKFYIFKIGDSIYELDVEPYLLEKEEKIQTFYKNKKKK